jgi:hypothetical protein
VELFRIVVLAFAHVLGAACAIAAVGVAIFYIVGACMRELSDTLRSANAQTAIALLLLSIVLMQFLAAMPNK